MDEIMDNIPEAEPQEAELLVQLLDEHHEQLIECEEPERLLKQLLEQLVDGEHGHEYIKLYARSVLLTQERLELIDNGYGGFDEKLKNDLLKPVDPPWWATLAQAVCCLSGGFALLLFVGGGRGDMEEARFLLVVCIFSGIIMAIGSSTTDGEKIEKNKKRMILNADTNIKQFKKEIEEYIHQLRSTLRQYRPVDKTMKKEHAMQLLSLMEKIGGKNRILRSLELIRARIEKQAELLLAGKEPPASA